MVDSHTITKFLDIPDELFNNWKENLNIYTPCDNNGKEFYTENAMFLFEKIKDLASEGVNFKTIKKVLLNDINTYNQEVEVHYKESYIVFSDKFPQNTDLIHLNSSLDTDTHTINNGELSNIFSMFVNEIKTYANRTIEAEKNKFIFEEKANRASKEFCELNTKMNKLQNKIEEKDIKIKELEESNKKIQKLDMHLKILQIEQNKKKPWEFWK